MEYTDTEMVCNLFDYERPSLFKFAGDPMIVAGGATNNEGFDGEIGSPDPDNPDGEI